MKNDVLQINTKPILRKHKKNEKQKKLILNV